MIMRPGIPYVRPGRSRMHCGARQAVIVLSMIAVLSACQTLEKTLKQASEQSTEVASDQTLDLVPEVDFDVTRVVQIKAPTPAVNNVPSIRDPVPSTVLAQVEIPDWLVGDTWRYSDGYALAVEKIDGPVTLFHRLDQPGQWFSRNGFLREAAQSATAHRQVVYRSIDPRDLHILQKDRPVVFTRETISNGQQRVHATSWQLEGRERIRVPAGEFDCYVIVMRTRNPLTKWTAFERWWYSPKLRHYVRLEYRYGPQPIGSRVLTEYAIDARIAAVER